MRGSESDYLYAVNRIKKGASDGSALEDLDISFDLFMTEIEFIDMCKSVAEDNK